MAFFIFCQIIDTSFDDFSKSLLVEKNHQILIYYGKHLDSNKMKENLVLKLGSISFLKG